LSAKGFPRYRSKGKPSAYFCGSRCPLSGRCGPRVGSHRGDEAANRAFARTRGLSSKC